MRKVIAEMTILGIVLGLTLSANAIEVVTIRMTGVPAQYELIVSEFNRLHENIRLEYERFPGDWPELAESLLIQIAADTAPDMTVLGTNITSIFRDSDLTIDVRPFIERDPEFSDQDFFPEVWRQHVRSDGSVHTVPTFLQIMNTYANINLFERAGLGLPSLDWEATWDKGEFLDVVRRIQSIGPDIHGTNISWDPHRWMQNLWRDGADWFIESDGILRSGLDQPKAIEAIQWMADLVYVHEVAPPPGVDSGWRQGRLGVFTQGSWATTNVNWEDLPFEWAALPIPRGSAGPATLMLPDPVAILSNTDHPEEAWEVVKFLTGQRAAELTGYGIPANREVALAVIDHILGPQGLEHKITTINGISYASAPPVTANWDKILQVAREGLSGVASGEEAPQTALQEVARQINLLLDEL